MTTAERPISADELHAYADDRLDALRRREVEHYLTTQPELARQVSGYRAQRDGLRMAFAASATEPIPPELNLNRLLEARLRRRPAWWSVAASGLLCLALGGAAGWYLGQPQQPSRTTLAMSLLLQQAMASHAVYTADPRHPIEMTAAEPSYLSQWLSDRLHRSVVPPDLTSAGYRLLGGRLVATERGGAAALFVYEDTHGDRVSVLLRPMAPELHAAREDASRGTLNSCTWIRNGMGFAIVAGLPDQTLDRIAEQINRQTAAPG